MRNSVWLIAIVLGLSCPGTTRADIAYPAGKQIQGRSYNDALKIWIPRKFGIWAAANGGQDYLVLQGESALGPATITLPKPKLIAEKLEAAVSRAIRWAHIARKHHADVSKVAGCVGPTVYDRCVGYRPEPKEGRMIMTFVASDQGRDMNLILEMTDSNNEFITATIYIPASKFPELRDAVDGIPKALAKAHKAAKNRALFK